MDENQHIVIVAGEESGDQHAAEMVKELKLTHPQLRFSGIGGKHMEAAGVSLISDLARYGVTGVTEVLRHLWIIRRAFKAIQAHLLKHPPALLVLVDYPGFNLRLAKFAKQHGIRVLFYISPQIWAWKAGRINTIRNYVDHMAVILPFEKSIYREAGVPVSFVGHPLIKRINEALTHAPSRESLNLPVDKRLIALLPGSRTHEMERHMPVMIEMAKQIHRKHHDVHFVIPVAGTLKLEKIADYYQGTHLPITLVAGQAIEVARCSDCIVVASGTASLECALLEKPMCIVYKGSAISYFLACFFIKIQYLGLCNILQHRMIVPELLQYDCNASELTKLVNQLLDDSDLSRSIKKNLRKLRQSLSIDEADESISELVLEQIQQT